MSNDLMLTLAFFQQESDVFLSDLIVPVDCGLFCLKEVSAHAHC